MRFELPSLEDAPPAPESMSGAPLQLPLALIDEDPEQPRKEFDEASLRELSTTIAERGVRSPISVRPHPIKSDRWMLNFGARRLRAARAAGCDAIPAFVDVTADSFDQVVENEQREALRPLELALFVQRQLVHGMTRSEVARRLGKSQAYVSMVCAMIDPPDCLMAAYRGGKCQGLTELYELRRLHGFAPARVEEFLGTVERVGRSNVEELRASVEPKTAKSMLSRDNPGSAQTRQAPPVVPTPRGHATLSRHPEDPRASGLILTACLAGEVVHVRLDFLPTNPNEVYVATSGQDRKAVVLDKLTDLALRRE